MFLPLHHVGGRYGWLQKAATTKGTKVHEGKLADRSPDRPGDDVRRYMLRLALYNVGIHGNQAYGK
jgi:hypothetical protein